jgi:Raf kinase inhibitor-like YbhB/YbcL family protein
MIRRLAPALVLAVLVAGCGSTPPPSASASAAATALASPSPPSSPASPAATPGGTSEPATSAPSPSSAPGGPTPSPIATPAGFALTSAAFHVDGAIPARFTCDGRNVSPAMAWTGVPDGTAWLVLIVDDMDAHDFTHWTVYGISPATARLDEGAGSATSTRLAQGTNDFGSVGYGGPCPPSGTHRYVFTLYALAAPLGLSGAPAGAAVRAALAKAHVLGKASITARYARGG